MKKYPVNSFRAAGERVRTELRNLTPDHKKCIGFFCTYSPMELILAAGFHPVRIEGGKTFPAEADALTPGFICPFLRTALNAGLKGEYRALSGMVQGYTCDAACGVFNIWRENVGGRIFHSLPLPYNDNPDARAFMRRAFEELMEKLVRAGGAFSDNSLAEAVDLYARLRENALALSERRHLFSAGDFNEIMRLGLIIHPEEYLDLLAEALHWTNERQLPGRQGIPVMVSGGLVEDDRVWTMLEECGAVVVSDDLCGGVRSWNVPMGEGYDSLERLIDRHFKRPPCPSRSRAAERADLLIQAAIGNGALAVVFLVQKFCTPQLADYPILKEKLNKAGLASIILELEESDPAGEGVRSRLLSFLEVLGG